MRAPFLLFAAALAGLSRPAAAQEPARLGIWIAGGIRPGHTRFAATRTFTEFAEQGHIDAQYREATGPAGEAGLGWRFARHLWVEGAASFTQRKEAGSFSAALPHPFFFGAFRHAEGDFAGRTARETAVHLDLAATGGRRLEWTLFAGPSLVAARVDLVRAVEYTHAYPYDVVTVTGAPVTPAPGHAAGFNAGAGLGWRVSPHLALGVRSRYYRATVRLRPTADEPVTVHAGGVLAIAGVAFDF